MSLIRRLAALGVWMLLAALTEPTPALTQQIRYGYDDLGRLQWVQDQNGEVAIYVYDPVGNILQIVRGTFPVPNAPVGISAFTPTRGPTGTTVTVFGRGFSGTPSQNQVTFNGVAATVSAASPNQLTAVAPAGATTGKIGITVGTDTGTSAQDFVVLLPPAVTPASSALYPKETLTFTSTQPAQWRANNVVNGNATVGTLAPSADGLSAVYTAPAAIPLNGVIQISAANRDDFTLVASATVEILPPATVDPLRSALVSVARAVAPVTASPLAAPLVATAREPVIIAAQDPATGQPARFPRGTANQNVRLLGAGFTGATTVVFNLAASSDSDITLNSFTVDSPTQITANISINAAAAVGFRVTRVTAAGITSTAQGTGGNLLEVLP